MYNAYYSYQSLIQAAEFAGHQTEILPGLVVGGINCDRGVNYGYPEDLDAHITPGANKYDTPVLNLPMGEKFDARGDAPGTFDLLVTTNLEWETDTCKIGGKTADEIYLKPGGKQVFAYVNSKHFDEGGLNQFMLTLFEAVNAWKEGKKVVVQCAQGCDRGVTFIICMLRFMTKMDPSAINDFVRRKRIIASDFNTARGPILENYKRALGPLGVKF